MLAEQKTGAHYQDKIVAYAVLVCFGLKEAHRLRVSRVETNQTIFSMTQTLSYEVDAVKFQRTILLILGSKLIRGYVSIVRRLALH